MKHNNRFQRWIITSFSGLTLAGTSLLSQAQAQTPAYIVDQFDSSAEVGYYQESGWNGSSGPSAVFNFNTNNAMTTVAGATNNPGSGSLEWMVDWDTYSAAQDMAGRVSLPTQINLADYTNLSFDIQFQTNCATDGNGSYGNIEVDLVGSQGWYQFTLDVYSSSVANGNGWIHVNMPTATAAATMNGTPVEGIGIKIQQNKTGSNLAGTTDFLIDNIIFSAATTPPTPPTLSISPITTPPGLLIVAQGGGNQYNRAELEATDLLNGFNFSWVGAGATPVTYSMTIAGYPDASHSGFESEIFLVPNGGNGDPAIDWDAANVAQMTIFNNSDGSATGSFQYKTNDAQDNSGFSGYGNLASIAVPTGPLGTWSITFVNDTNVTLSGPGGASTNVNFPDEATAQVFANPLTAYFGNQQGGTTANIGQGSTYSQFSISNTPYSTPFTDVFTNDGGVINTSQWLIDDAAPNNILIVQTNDAFWVNWTLPASGYSLFSSPTLGPGAVWSNTGLSSIVITTAGDQVLVPQSSLPASGQGFFVLVQPASP
ncbi:MAG: hypothetical protein ABSG59_11335 [Verrucomicrobiota bacterium]|jgi:hypothetical protein